MRLAQATTLGASLHLGLALAQSTVTLNPSTTYQTIDGFGFSEAFGFGNGVANAPSAQQTQALKYMFSTTEGAGMTILRNRIASDPNGSIEPNSPGSPSAAPSYKSLNGDSSQVFWSKQARAMGVKYIYADAWSAPGYMKTNDNYINGGYLCGVTGHSCSSGDWRQAYANYLVQYIKDYASQGITIDFVGFLNEPEFAPSYDSMLSDGTEAASFIPILHDTIQKAGLSTGITCCDAEGWNDQVKFTQQLISADATKYMSRITSHWYTSKCTAPINTSLRVWETEYADLDSSFSTTWHSSGATNEGFTWAQYIYQGLVECNLSAFLYWVGAQSNSNAAGLVTLTGSGSSTQVTASGSLWAFAMFSRYIRPDAVRIGTTGAPSNTKVASFKNTDGTIATVMINTGSSAQAVSLGGGSISSAKAYYMDNSVSSPSSLSITLNAGSVQATLPGYSMVTFVTSGSGSSTGPTTLTTHTTTSTTSASGSTGTDVAQHWAQCGGQGWTGPTTCASPYTCKAQNAYYSQCL
ncbi:Endo-1,4-beta-xylanase [Penicillium ucsense]|uniref:Endo-1,4-beta-xylanase n=1 Tax=Penicillium ucsense TaxID=2839758 RepID=A0A8J8VXL4_9EURO|nr:Endo-1,4-beta-xylanase [Penicillium ucsense]KAF7732959.1 Endo-1,4-beta-xylanase [Penicillium ucsense]